MKILEMPAGNTQYKTVGVQWFASVWFSLQRFPLWIRTNFENPTVSYCQTLGASVKNDTADNLLHKDRIEK